MTNTNPRSLIRRLADDLEGITEQLVIPEYAHTEKERTDVSLALVAEARAYLAQSEPADLNPFLLAWILFDCDGKLRPETQKVLAARGVIQPKPPNLKEEALLKLKELQALLQFENVDSSCIRRALEQLPDPS